MLFEAFAIVFIICLHLLFSRDVSIIICFACYAFMAWVFLVLILIFFLCTIYVSTAEKRERWPSVSSGGQGEFPKSPYSDRNTSNSIVYSSDGKGISVEKTSATALEALRPTKSHNKHNCAIQI